MCFKNALQEQEIQFDPLKLMKMSCH